MNNALLVSRFEGIGDLFGNLKCLINRNGPLGNSVRQRRTLDQFQDQRLGVLGALQAMDRTNIGMVQRGEDFGFPLETG